MTWELTLPIEPIETVNEAFHVGLYEMETAFFPRSGNEMERGPVRMIISFLLEYYHLNYRRKLASVSDTSMQTQ